MWQWLVENFMNGELFFYIIPAVLLIVLLIVVFLPDAERESGQPEQKPVLPPREPEPSNRLANERHDTISLGPLVAEGEHGERSVPEEPSSTPSVVVPPLTSKSYAEGLEKTRSNFFSRLAALFRSSTVDNALIEQIEEILYTADVGVTTVSSLIADLRANRDALLNGDTVRAFLKERIRNILKQAERPFVVGEARPFVILVVGVNGVGKTTTIGKLAARFSVQGLRVLVVAADTFRAAAAEQLAVWGGRTGVEVALGDREGADPAAVAYRAVSRAVSEKFDVVMIDTAGRLQNRSNLMEELRKIHRVVGKEVPGAPHEVLLVVDANNGQNAVVQAKEFGETVGVTGIVAVKLDGTAKGGSLIGIARELQIPIYFTGIGETAADLRPFDANEFTEALFA